MTCETCIHRIETTCHRYPPQLYPNQVRVWPTVAMGDTCGEYDEGEEVDKPAEGNPFLGGYVAGMALGVMLMLIVYWSTGH